MSRKQVGFAFRVLPYSQTDPNRSSLEWTKYIKENYQDLGWEVQNTEIAKVEGNDIFLGVTLVKYEDALVSQEGSVGKLAKSG